MIVHRSRGRVLLALALIAVVGFSSTSAQRGLRERHAPTSRSADECSLPHAAWIWCDDFERDRLHEYFEYDDGHGSFARANGVGLDGSIGMRARFSAGQQNAGALHLAFGRVPSSDFRTVDDARVIHRDVYWRFYLRNAPGWSAGGGDKLTRAISFASPNSWAEAMIAHVWSGSPPSQDYLVIDPASGLDRAGVLRTSRYNDFAHLRWLGAARARMPTFDADHIGRWHCIEVHAKLDDPGRSNGVFELWIDETLAARRDRLAWVGSFAAYGINAVFLENYWNGGAPKTSVRDFDNFVVSSERIGCLPTASRDSARP